VRIQLDVSSAKLKQIRELMRVADFKNYPDLLNNAVAMVGWAVRHVQSGHVIVAFDDRKNVMKELSMPFLEHISQSNTDERPREDEEFAETEELLEEARRQREDLEAQLRAAIQRAEKAEASANAPVVRTRGAGSLAV
jgi:hypothetical protein